MARSPYRARWVTAPHSRWPFPSTHLLSISPLRTRASDQAWTIATQDDPERTTLLPQQPLLGNPLSSRIDHVSGRHADDSLVLVSRRGACTTPRCSKQRGAPLRGAALASTYAAPQTSTTRSRAHPIHVAS